MEMKERLKIYTLKNRILVIGNSGSGKSTLASAIGKLAHYPVIDLDAIHWHDAHSGQKRDEGEAMQMVDRIAQGQKWVIEGVYGWLAEIALERADSLIWLNLPWQECCDGLNQRQKVKQTPVPAFLALVDWAQDYWRRETSSSFKGHSHLFEKFDGYKVELAERQAVNIFVKGLIS